METPRSSGTAGIADGTGTKTIDTAARAPSPEYPVRFHTLTRVYVNPWGLRGAGSVQIAGNELRLWRTGTRGMQDDLRVIPLYRIRDVTIAGERMLKFMVDPPDASPFAIRVIFDSVSDARRVALDLPDRVSSAELDERGRTRVYQNALSDGRSTPVTTLLILANLALYIATGVMGGNWNTSDSPTLIRLGSNFGPYTTNGDWWRLVSATFLHAGWLHLAVNMITLNDTGRLCERLYGRGRYLLLYFATGLIGSITSLWWNPWVHGVGASGAVFGVLGATFLFLVDRRNGVPASVMRSHLFVMGVFIVYALVSGFGRDQVDNAAHVGGLVSGLVLGLGLARPLSNVAGVRPVALALAVALLVGGSVAMLEKTPRTYEAWQNEKRFFADMDWFGSREKQLLSETSAVIDKAQRRQIRQADASAELKRIAEEWKRVEARLGAYRLDPVSKNRTLQEKFVAYVNARSRGATALHLAVVSGPEAGKRHLAAYNGLRREADDYARQIHDWRKQPGAPPRP